MKIEDLEKAERNVSVDGLPIAVAQRAQARLKRKLSVKKGSRGGR
ncbi:hypothetical protein ACIQWQ_08580 [Peribacillus frigoritolerans]